MNPRDSGPATTFAPTSSANLAIWSQVSLKASPLAKSGVISLNKIPSIGKSFTAAI